VNMLLHQHQQQQASPGVPDKAHSSQQCELHHSIATGASLTLGLCCKGWTYKFEAAACIFTVHAR
jgi:hypothetical protein